MGVLPRESGDDAGRRNAETRSAVRSEGGWQAAPAVCKKGARPRGGRRALAVLSLDRFEPSWRLMGLDVGRKTIGLACGQPALGIAAPLTTIWRTRFVADAERLFGLVDGEAADALVIGLPVNMDGTEGARCQSVRRFAENLLARRDMPVAFWDERLSTAAVTRAMVSADISRRRRAAAVDRLAAAYILQGALDFLRRPDARGGAHRTGGLSWDGTSDGS